MLLLYIVEGDILNKSQAKGKFTFKELLIVVIITSIFSIFSGIMYGKWKYSDVITVDTIKGKENNEALTEFITQYKYIISNYYDKDSIDEEELLNIALKSILDELGMSDAHSLYMDEESYNQLNINLNGSYEGLGITAGKEAEDSNILIVNIIQDSPASKVDIQPGDYIVSIDGKDTSKMTTQEFSQYVIKSEEKNFALKIKRGTEIKTLNIQKGEIELKSVTSKVIKKDNKKIGYIYTTIFASNTYTQFKQQLKELEKQNIDALIIDLRGNTGGHLKETGKILSLFLDKKNIIYQLKNDEETVKYYSKGTETKKYPIVFISDEITASAAEVLIISLKDNLGAKLVGKKTYGKGTVQELITLTNGDQYKITTKKWLSPKGTWINETEGIVPDVEVELSEDYINNPIESNDSQLQSALDVTIAEINKKEK